MLMGNEYGRFERRLRRCAAPQTGECAVHWTRPAPPALKALIPLQDTEKPMSADLQTPATQTLLEAAHQAGLSPTVAAGTDFHGRPTTRLAFATASSAAPLTLELSDAFTPSTSELREGFHAHLRALAHRLRNLQPDLDVTFAGIPLRFSGFQWPFHRSTSGADTYLVHGTVHLADGTDSPLHAKVSASMTVTFAEIVQAPEQPYAEDFTYNAIRKTFDYGQLELIKSGNRQPVLVTTRYYSRWGKRFQFTDTTPESRRDFLALKAFWLSGVHGGGAPVWLADPRDTQYLNTTPEELAADAQALTEAGLLTPSEPGFYAAAPALLAREAGYRAQLAEALNQLKPAFNESMRAGQTNM